VLIADNGPGGKERTKIKSNWRALSHNKRKVQVVRQKKKGKRSNKKKGVAGSSAYAIVANRTMLGKGGADRIPKMRTRSKDLPRGGR